MPLQHALNLTDPDAIYQALADAHSGLTADASAALNARLVLILINHVGDVTVIREAIDIAAAAAPGPNDQ